MKDTLEEQKQKINELITETLKKVKKEKDIIERKRLEEETESLIRSRKELTNITNAEDENFRKNQELSLKIDESVEKQHQMKKEEKLERFKQIGILIGAGTSIVGAITGLAKLNMQNNWVKSAINYETTGTFSTKTTGGIANSVTKI